MTNIPANVEEKLAQLPKVVHTQLLALRALILEVAAQTPQVGELVETLKWGEPAYLPKKRNVGTTVRIGPSKIKDYALFVHCQTTLIDDFRHMFPDEFHYEGNRGIHFNADDPIDRARLALLISKALTYHLK